MHPYTQALIRAVPVPDPVVQEQRPPIILKGDTPDPAHPPVGCNFSNRCPFAMDICRAEDPKLLPHRPGGSAACHLHTLPPPAPKQPMLGHQSFRYYTPFVKLCPISISDDSTSPSDWTAHGELVEP
ncbi:MAG: hypothetical protein MUP62_04250 [Dehalococcoidia bacterium]|nr:hypothetical protein [Dehalococcoidia bacterium]